MKKLALITIVILCTISTALNAQCKYRRKVNGPTKALATACNTTIDAVTKGKVLFSKYRTAASFAMAKGGSNYYFIYTFQRANSSRFELLKDNSLDLYLSDGNKVQLYPCNAFSSMYLGLSFNLMINCLYQIDKQQLELLSKSEVTMVSMHYTAEKELNGSQVDKDGKFSLDYEVSSKTNQGNPGLLSQCILNK